MSRVLFPVCRDCGCTDDHACIGLDSQPCHWAEEDLCSTCAGKQQYALSLSLVGQAATLLSLADLDTVLRTIGMAESVGPILEPTMYRNASVSGSLRQQREIVEAAIALRDVAQRIQKELVEKAKAEARVSLESLGFD